MTLKLATLCSGIDGFGVGFESAGFETVFQCERDPSCLRILARHWPNVERTEDVDDPRTLESLVRLRPAIALLILRSFLVWVESWGRK